MKGGLLEALPLFLAAVLGVWLYYSILPFSAVLPVLAVLALIGWLMERIAKALLRHYPVAAVYVWQVEVLMPIALIALGGYASIWVVDCMPKWLAMIPLLDIPTATTTSTEADSAKEWTKTVSAALSTAITAFLGALILDEEKKADGGLWPPARIRKGMTDAFSDKVDRLKEQFNPHVGESKADYDIRMAGSAPQLVAYETASRAIYSEEMAIDLPSGWSLPGALARARIVRVQFLNAAERRH